MIFKPHGLVFVIFLLISFSTAHQLHADSCASNPNGDSSSILLVGCLSAIVFCFVGILPSYFIKSDTDEQKFVNSEVFKCLLAFAAGSLLADVFLHLIPEVTMDRSEHEIKRIGLISIAAFVIFLIIEKTTELIPNAHALGTLNLIANFLDNSAHGTSVVGAFQNSLKFGMVALLATVIHEVPHEFSDFALLLKDGYTRKSAVLAQLITAFSGTISATLVYALSSTQAHFERCSNLNNTATHSSHHSASSLPLILPFTIGGFLYIALVGIIPDLIKEEDTRVSCKQLVSFLVGIIFIFSLGEIELLLPYLIGGGNGTTITSVEL